MYLVARTVLTALVSLTAACGADSNSAAERSAALSPTADAASLPAAASAKPQEPARTVAVTFDDLPHARSDAHSLAFVQQTTERLLRALRVEDIPAVGFVNERQIDRAEHPRARTALLQAWLDAGIELGNHTWGHPKFWDTPLGEYQDQVLRGERVTRRLMAAQGDRPRFFRHPFLNTGPDLETKRAFEDFLAEHDYRVAPVTIDNDEYIYALAYDRVAQQGDSALLRRIGEDYVRYMDEVFAFYEALSRRLLGREPAQVLLLHANRLNADYLEDLAAMMRERGYGFVSLEEALEDPAYEQPDEYTGRSGPSWLQRWAITQGEEPGEQPPVSDWVQRIAYPRG